MKPILETILESTRVRVEAAKRSKELDALRRRAQTRRSTVPAHAFLHAVRQRDRLNVIAEFKRASPSKGIINNLANPADTARTYQESGACAISVLTEPEFFKGSLEDLQSIRAAVGIPILRKDFVVDEFQIYEAAAAGADAVLLIVAALGKGELARLRSIVEELGMDALVEVHTEDELMIAANIGAEIVGVNNRDLRTFEVSLDVSRRLVGFAPPNALMVSESGITNREEMLELRSLGYSAFLIGEALMRHNTAGLGAEVLR